MKPLIYVAILAIGACQSQAQESQKEDCYQKTPFAFVKKRLSTEICIPFGHTIVSIEELDLDKDGLSDKVVKYFKDYPRQNGDSTFFALYSKQVSGSYRHLRTYGNLASRYFAIKDQDEETVLNDSALNSLKNKYQDFGVEPKFIEDEVIISFYVDAAKYVKLFFTYSGRDNDYKLTKKEIWFAPRTSNWEGEEELVDKALYEEGVLFLSDFNMLDYLL